MCSIGERLKKERIRLKYNQTAFAEIGAVGKTTQINYEKNLRCPDARYLAAISGEGADILFIVTGSRSLTSELTPEENELISNYRALQKNDRQAIHQISETMAAYKVNNDSE